MEIDRPIELGAIFIGICGERSRGFIVQLLPRSQFVILGLRIDSICLDFILYKGTTYCIKLQNSFLHNVFEQIGLFQS